MGAASRRKGVGFERVVGAYLRERGYEAERRDQTRQDHGWPDLACSVNGRPLSIECKCVATMPGKADLAALEQCEAAERAEGVKVACVKVPGKSVGQSIVILRLEDFAKIFQSANRPPDPERVAICDRAWSLSP